MQVELIAEIKFKDTKVIVYLDQNASSPDALYCCWKMRNPETSYSGYVYMDPTGKISYPVDAIIPVQTKYDREMLPTFILTGSREFNIDTRKKLDIYLNKEYKRRNK